MVHFYEGCTMILKQRKQNRLKNYDYSQSGYYFVTICTQNREEWFGRIENGVMGLNGNGQIVENQWVWLAKQYPYVVLDSYVVMPNHFHGVIGINVGHGRDRSLQKIKSLSELVGAFKTTSSKLIHNSGIVGFHWQKSFYDHVIRDELSLDRIREYVINNPKQWDKDIENNLNARNDAGGYYKAGPF